MYALIHKNGKVIAFDEIADVNAISTTAELFTGTKAECEAEIERLSLLYKVYSTLPDGERYHRLDCQYIQAEDNPIEWESVEAAQDAGLTACEICILRQEI